jgi:hypothetical protein
MAMGVVSMHESPIPSGRTDDGSYHTVTFPSIMRAGCTLPARSGQSVPSEGRGAPSASRRRRHLTPSGDALYNVADTRLKPATQSPATIGGDGRVRPADGCLSAEGRSAVLDVREPYERDAGRIDGAVHHPLNDVPNGPTEGLDQSRPVVATAGIS